MLLGYLMVIGGLGGVVVLSLKFLAILSNKWAIVLSRP